MVEFTAATPTVSVIVPHYDDLSALDACLASVIGQELSGDFEIIVADNMSPVGLAAVASRIAGRARLIEAVERGAGPARNVGVAAARGALLAFIDSDCVAEPGWLKAGAAALGSHAVVGGPVRVSTGGRPRSGAEIFELAFAFKNERYIAEEGFSVTANLFCSRATFDAVGGFDVGLSEDKEWCHRARSLGFSLGLAAGAVVRHPARRNWKQLTGKWRRITRETMLYEAAAGSPVWRWHLRQVAVAASPIVHSWSLLRLADTTLAERLRGLGTLFAIRIWRAWDGLTLSYPRKGK